MKLYGVIYLIWNIINGKKYVGRQRDLSKCAYPNIFTAMSYILIAL